MKIKEIENSRLAKLLGYSITLYPYIFYKGVPSRVTRKHESIHIKQIESLGVFKFYISYVWYYITNRFKGMDHDTAYLKIPYEIEAYTKQWEL